MSGTDTRIAPPDCKNCGCEMQDIYVCDRCISKLKEKYRAIIAENAELRRERDIWKGNCDHNACLFDASNAILDSLRDRLPEYDNHPEEWGHRDLSRCVRDIHAILYPVPQNGAPI